MSCVCCVLEKVGGECFGGVLSFSRVAASFPNHTVFEATKDVTPPCTSLTRDPATVRLSCCIQKYVSSYAAL